MTLKEAIICDLHKILFGTTLKSAPDSWDILVGMAKAVIDHHKLFFKDKEEICDNQYWKNSYVDDHFFDFIAPGISLTEAQFTIVCDRYFDWELFEAKQPIEHVFESFELAMGKLREINKAYGVIALVDKGNVHSFPYLKSIEHNGTNDNI